MTELMQFATSGITTISGQDLSIKTFAISKIRDRVRLYTGLPNLIIDQFLTEVIREFCEKTWILQKTIELGDVVAIDINDIQTNRTTPVDLGTVSDETVDFDISRSVYFELEVAGDITITFSGFQDGTLDYVTIAMTNGGAHTITWPDVMMPKEGVVSDLTADGEDIITVYSVDGGTTIPGPFIAADIKVVT